jgi:hypothetical protein
MHARGFRHTVRTKNRHGKYMLDVDDAVPGVRLQHSWTKEAEVCAKESRDDWGAAAEPRQNKDFE